MPDTTLLLPRLRPVRAQLRGVDSIEDVDRVTDWDGARARAVVATATRMPELAAEDDDVDGFDPATMSGQVTAWPTILGRPFRMGFYTWHQIEPGAFDESISEQDGRIPIYVQHNWDWSERPPVGHTRTAAEVDVDDGADDANGEGVEQARAIEISGRLYPDVPDGLAVLHGLAARALREWSIGYLVEEYTAEEDEESGRRLIRVLRAQLWEASVVLRGANPWTQTLDVASRPDEVPPTAAPAAQGPDPYELSPDAIASSPSLRAALARIPAPSGTP